MRIKQKRFLIYLIFSNSQNSFLELRRKIKQKSEQYNALGEDVALQR